ncbi:MAG: AIR synthase related protein, partial [Gammaproteobacteria bacterium]|nr:AIR synthase related protein [Gammaproteobacteria bacterium]
MEACATPLAPGHDAVVAVDTLVAGVHFPLDTPAADIGHKALAVNLSDLAAMAAEPLAAAVSLTRETRDASWLAAFRAGLEALAGVHRVRLGAILERRGPLCVSVEAIGQVPQGAALTRGGARPGDAIYVTGTLGDAGL